MRALISRWQLLSDQIFPLVDLESDQSAGRQLVRLNNMSVMGSSPEWAESPYVGLTILLCVISKSLKAIPT